LPTTSKQTGLLMAGVTFLTPGNSNPGTTKLNTYRKSKKG